VEGVSIETTHGRADQVPTGIPALDESIGGGFPRGSLILLKGAPGTGKTLLASRFLYEGVSRYGEEGIYVSFSESKETFNEDMKPLGYDFPRLEREGKHSFLNYTALRGEATPTILTQIIQEIQRIKAKRLVIDSFRAIAAATPDRTTVRTILHGIFSKITRALNCTTLLITERSAEPEAKPGPEEYIADATIALRRTEYDDRPLRTLEILKMRGRRITTAKLLFTTENGPEVYTPLKEPTPPPKPRKWTAIPDSAERFSTGNPDLDSLLGGGYPRGSYVLIEIGENVPDTIRNLLTEPLMLNFLSQSRGVTVIPRPNSSARALVKSLEPYTSRETILTYLKVHEKAHQVTHGEVTLPYEGVNIDKDYLSYVEAWRELKKKTCDRPILRIVAEDTSECTYGLQAILGVIPQSVARTAIHRDLSLAIATPHLQCTRHLAQLANIHIKVREHRGYMLVYGEKPHTDLHIAEIDTSRGAPELKLHPIR
jgi:KaiC/GvpD/RAD55 family RecA-like ATPase